MKRKTLLAWVREILSPHESELTEIPSTPPEETVDKLINKASGDKLGSNDKPCGCTYAMKRNLVESLEEIRRFAEKHDLAAAVIKALLTLLAEMALGAMQGKVGEKALETLLRAFTYSQHVSDAYMRGKNEMITKEYFPDTPDIPHLGGMQKKEEEESNIFTMAREA